MSAPTHILTSHVDELQEKGHDTAELEHIKQPVDQPNLETESRFASLGRLAAARVFWKSILWAFLASVGALFDGYAIVSKCTVLTVRKVPDLVSSSRFDRCQQGVHRYLWHCAQC
jgi:hypothetical protein